MAELSANWKKLQAQLNLGGQCKERLKRKAEAQDHFPAKRKRANKQSASLVLDHKIKQKISKMGGVQSSLGAENLNGSPSLSTWVRGDVTSEHLAEAYCLGMNENSLVLAAANDKVNHGLSSGFEIGKYIAIDCEMVGVGQGGYESSLARVSVVDFHGRQVYDSYARPKERVTDWRTSVSGISQKEMRFAREFDEVQRDIYELLKNRILIGHDIKHDLHALSLCHPRQNVRDTAKYPGFKSYGNGRKPSLKILAREIIGIEIQEGPHSSTEDARAAMFLFRKHKSGFDADHASRYVSKASSSSKSHEKSNH